MVSHETFSIKRLRTTLFHQILNMALFQNTWSYHALQIKNIHTFFWNRKVKINTFIVLHFSFQLNGLNMNFLKANTNDRNHFILTFVKLWLLNLRSSVKKHFTVPQCRTSPFWPVNGVHHKTTISSTSTTHTPCTLKFHKNPQMDGFI